MSTVDKEAPMGPSSSSDQEKHFTVFIRLPFPRGDFVDPPPVKWDAAKDQRLWDILSRASKGHEIDCELIKSSAFSSEQESNGF